MISNTIKELKEKSDQLLVEMFTGDVEEEETSGFFKRIRRIPQRMFEHEWLAILIIVIIAIILGISGFTDYFSSESYFNPHTGGYTRTEPIWNILWLTFQLFTLGGIDFTGNLPWQLILARLLTAMLLAYVGSRAIQRIFRERWELIKLNIYRNHVIICGLGSKGIKLVKDFRMIGKRVVAIEIKSENEKINVARRAGAIVLTGDATDENLLCRVGVKKASYLMAVTNKDEANIEIAVDAYNLIEKSQKYKLHCVAHIKNLRLLNIFKERNLLPDHEKFTLDFFNLYENASRWLFYRYPLEDNINPDKDIPHLVVLGFEEMGQSIVLEALKQGHYAKGKELRITIFDDKADEKKKEFEENYPEVNKISEKIEFRKASMEQVTKKCSLIKELATMKDINSIIICPKNDTIGLSCALTLLPSLKANAENSPVPIFIHMEHDAGLATLLQNEDKFQKDRIRPFGMINHISTRQMVVNEWIISLARCNYHIYNYAKTKELSPKYLKDMLLKEKGDDFPEVITPKLEDWINLQRLEKNSNLQQAYHIPYKLRAINCGIRKPVLKKVGMLDRDKSTKQEPFSFTNDEIEILARIEHRRWMEVQFLKGYTLDDTIDREDDVEGKHSYLLPFDKLPKEVQDFDRRTAIIIPRILRELEIEIFRLPQE
ncbi:MAG: NAD-binding protein [Candidatus Hermodarchaeota archaeon]